MEPSLESLPDEIILVIAECIVADLRFPQRYDYLEKQKPVLPILRKLARCCRRFNDIIRPVLYRQVLVESEYRDRVVNLKKLLCLVLRFPTRALYIRRLAASVPLTNDPISVSAISRKDWNRIKIAVKDAATCPEDALGWYQSIEKGQCDALLALLLSRLSNLEEFDLNN